MSALDIFVILLLGGGAIIGFVRGFVHEVLSLFAWVVAIAMLKLFHTPAVDRADRHRRDGRGRGRGGVRLAVHPELPAGQAAGALDRRQDAASRCWGRSTGCSAAASG